MNYFTDIIVGHSDDGIHGIFQWYKKQEEALKTFIHEESDSVVMNFRCFFAH